MRSKLTADFVDRIWYTSWVAFQIMKNKEKDTATNSGELKNHTQAHRVSCGVWKKFDSSNAWLCGYRSPAFHRLRGRWCYGWNLILAMIYCRLTFFVTHSICRSILCAAHVLSICRVLHWRLGHFSAPLRWIKKRQLISTHKSRTAAFIKDFMRFTEKFN